MCMIFTMLFLVCDSIHFVTLFLLFIVGCGYQALSVWYHDPTLDNSVEKKSIIGIHLQNRPPLFSAYNSCPN